MRLRAVLLLGLFASGCVGPRPELPIKAAVVAPPAWRTSLGEGDPVRANWWTTFGDPVLTSLVAQALAANDDLAIAATRIEEARAQARLARAERAPELAADLPLAVAACNDVRPGAQ